MINEKYCVFVYPNEHANINMYGETFIGSFNVLGEAYQKAIEYVDGGAFVSIVKDVYVANNNNMIVLSNKYGEEVEEIGIAKWVHFMKICGEMD